MTNGLKGSLYSTVVGSFPCKVDRALISEEDWSRVDEIREASFDALRFQLDCGIDFPSDGQFYDMVEMYLEPLKGSSFLKGDRHFGDGPIPKKHPATRLESELEREARKEGAQGLRVPITGPFTLAYRVKNDGKNLIEASDSDGLQLLGSAVKSYCKGFDRALSGSILSVDEPVLPFVVPAFGKDFIIGVLNQVFGTIKNNYKCMHVCGGVGSIKDLAMSLDVDILDHEFQGTDNEGVYTKEDLEISGKLLSYGAVNSNPQQVFSKDGRVHIESVDTISSSLEAASAVYGLENLLVSPDCGFAGWRSLRLPEDEKWRVIKEKLCNIVKARNVTLPKHS
jgi:methionine synthase II (cobalamin-independent)